MNEITLSPQEQIAIRLLQSQPDIFMQIVNKQNNTIDINEVYKWFVRLTLNLEVSKQKRKGEFTDVAIVPASSVIPLPQENLDNK